jgi:low temperature requirement protein LtrA
MGRSGKDRSGEGERWVRPPVLRTTENTECRPTWTELFFDLVFMVAVG